MFRVELFQDGVSQGKIMEYNRSFKRNYKSVIAISDIDNFGTDADLSIKMADEGELENDPTTDLPWQGAVSYTHLDVYKRQILILAICRNEGIFRIVKIAQKALVKWQPGTKNSTNY